MMKKLSLILALICCSSALSAKTFDLRERNLAPVIFKLVKMSKAANTFDALPALIKNTHEQMEQGNFTIANLELLQELGIATKKEMVKASKASI